MRSFPVRETGPEVNYAFYNIEKTKGTSLLMMACLGSEGLAVGLLLKEGAEPKCPGLPDTALESRAARKPGKQCKRP